MEQKKYEYTYDSARQTEIQKIREKYTLPVYTRTLQKGRIKIAPDILQLSDELLK